VNAQGVMSDCLVNHKPTTYLQGVWSHKVQP